MRSACALSSLLCLAAVGISAQQSDQGQPTLTVRSTLVEVPILLKTKGAEVVFGLTADDFLVTDNGVPQRLTLDQDTDSQPLALAIVVETGGAGARHLVDYRQLDSILEALIGNVEHRVAIIGFDSMPHLLMLSHPGQMTPLSDLQAWAKVTRGQPFWMGLHLQSSSCEHSPLAIAVRFCCSVKPSIRAVRQHSMRLCASSVTRIRQCTASAFPVHALQSPMKHQSLGSGAQIQALRTAALAEMAPILSTKGTASRCSTVSASLLRRFGWRL
jgi:hypothetical protein